MDGRGDIPNDEASLRASKWLKLGLGRLEATYGGAPRGHQIRSTPKVTGNSRGAPGESGASLVSSLNLAGLLHMNSAGGI